MHCIYKIYSQQFPDRFYVGSAVSFRVRKNSHICRLRKGNHHNPLLQNHVNKCGVDDLVFEIIESVADISLILIIEQKYIDALAPYFNIAKIAGNTLGTKRSFATKKLISELKKGNSHNTGRRLSDEHKENISKGNKGKAKTEKHKQKLRDAALSRDCEAKDKYRKAQLGKKQTTETKAKISAATKGSNNPRWKGGISKTYQRRQQGKGI